MSLSLPWALRLARAADLVSDVQSGRINGTTFAVGSAIPRANPTMGGLVWGDGKTTVVSILADEMVLDTPFFACPITARLADITGAI